MPVDIEKGAHEARIAEVNETFEYAKNVALETLAKKKVIGMSFTLSFQEGWTPTVSHEISEAL